jgi:two-component system, NarL family, nitrate/nitrite response regulator NarL
MNEFIQLGILENHQDVIDNYLSRLANAPDIQVTPPIRFGELLAPALQAQSLDVLILDVSVPTSSSNPAPYPIVDLISTLVKTYPSMDILVISLFTQFSLVRLLIEAGVRGYILKDDRSSIMNLPAIIHQMHKGKPYFSPEFSGKVEPFAVENIAL